MVANLRSCCFRRSDKARLSWTSHPPPPPTFKRSEVVLAVPTIIIILPLDTLKYMSALCISSFQDWTRTGITHQVGIIRTSTTCQSPMNVFQPGIMLVQL